MSFEINPVLAGKFDAPADDSATINASVTGGNDSASAVDSRRYTQFDRTITDAGTATMSFGDIVDMLNPLEHIPVVSSVYRAITGDTINPVARVTGDILYGGAMGIGSAVLGGVGAIADTEIASENGKDSSGLVLSALFGPDETDNPVQLASADTGKTTSSPAAGNSLPPPAGTQNMVVAQVANVAQPAQAALQIPVNSPNMPSSPAPNAAPATPPVSSGMALNTHSSDAPSPFAAPTAQDAEAAVSPPTAASAPPANSPVTPSSAASSPAPTASTPTAPSGTIPMLASTKGANASKQAFGGVMAPPQGNIQAQDMAMALAEGAPSMRMGHTIYTNRLMNGPHPLPPMLSSGNAPAVSSTTPAPAYAPPPVLPATSSFTSSSAMDPSAAAASLLANSGQNQSFAAGGMSTMPPAFMQDMMFKAVSQYRSVASGPGGNGGSLNLTN
jgi:hypothetical protein